MNSINSENWLFGSPSLTEEQLEAEIACSRFRVPIDDSYIIFQVDSPTEAQIMHELVTNCDDPIVARAHTPHSGNRLRYSKLERVLGIGTYSLVVPNQPTAIEAIGYSSVEQVNRIRRLVNPEAPRPITLLFDDSYFPPIDYLQVISAGLRPIAPPHSSFFWHDMDASATNHGLETICTPGLISQLRKVAADRYLLDEGDSTPLPGTEAYSYLHETVYPLDHSGLRNPEVSESVARILKLVSSTEDPSDTLILELTHMILSHAEMFEREILLRVSRLPDAIQLVDH